MGTDLCLVKLVVIPASSFLNLRPQKVTCQFLHLAVNVHVKTIIGLNLDH